VLQPDRADRERGEAVYETRFVGQLRDLQRGRRRPHARKTTNAGCVGVPESPDIRGLRSTSARFVRTIRVSRPHWPVWPPPSGTPGAEYLLDLALDLLEVHELAVDGGKADVRNLVQVTQAVHHHLSDLLARDLHPARAPQLRLDVVHDRTQPLRRDVALFGRLLQAVEQLLGVKVLTP